jgi:membrane dipeptidase
MRYKFANNVSAIDLESEMPGHVDIPRLRKGKVGGFFWWVNELYHAGFLTNIVFRSVYVSCPNPVEAGRNFLGATWRVRYVLPLATCPLDDTSPLVTPWNKSMWLDC